MDKFDRMQQLHRVFASRKTPISLAQLAIKLECSEKTIYRAIQNLQDFVQAPLAYCEETKGWYYDKVDSDRFELPGLWLTAEEINGLAIMLELVSKLEASWMGDDLELVTKAIEHLLTSRKIQLEQFRSKVSYLPKRKFVSESRVFQTISAALMKGRCLQIEYCDYRGRVSRRIISPIKLVHYDENWYLDAWCHLRSELRSFLVARIGQACSDDTQLQNISNEELQNHFSGSYGIFSGRAKHQARLRFSGTAAREAASFQWHPQQQCKWVANDYLLEIPYNDDRELVRTLLGFGADVEILAPTALRNRLLSKAKQIVTTYEPGWGGGKF